MYERWNYYIFIGKIQVSLLLITTSSGICTHSGATPELRWRTASVRGAFFSTWASEAPASCPPDSSRPPRASGYAPPSQGRLMGQERVVKC